MYWTESINADVLLIASINAELDTKRLGEDSVKENEPASKTVSEKVITREPAASVTPEQLIWGEIVNVTVPGVARSIKVNDTVSPVVTQPLSPGDVSSGAIVATPAYPTPLFTLIPGGFDTISWQEIANEYTVPSFKPKGVSTESINAAPA